MIIINEGVDFQTIAETISIGGKTIPEEIISGIKILTEIMKGDKTMEINSIAETIVKVKMTTLATEEIISMTETTSETNDTTTTGI